MDRAIEILAPGYALKRYHARARLEIIHSRFEDLVRSEKRRYEGASAGRHYSDWYSPNLSVNQEILQSLAILRERSRDLCRNNAYAINAIRAIKNNTVGTGIIPTPKSGNLGKNQLKTFKSAFSNWANSTLSDYDDTNTFYGLQNLVMRVVAESGECLIRKVRGTSSDSIPLRLQILEGDYINSSYHTGVWQQDNTITYYGIKFDRTGRRLGYWLYKGHPSEFGTESEFVLAKDIIHVYEVERPGQIRGIPFSCGVMLRLKDLEDYEFTERIRNKVAAAFAVFVTDDVATDNTSGSKINDLEQVEPGMIKTLLPGQSIQVAQPPISQGFGEYVKSNLRGVSAGFGTSYEVLSNDYSNVNFSSGRMGSMEFNLLIEQLQNLLIIPRFCDKVFIWFVEACQLKGIIPFSANVTASWTAPRRQMIDPLKEIQALREGLRAGLYSWQEVVRMLGYVPEDLIEELAQDSQMWDKLKLKPSIDPRFDPNRSTDEPVEQKEAPIDE